MVYLMLNLAKDAVALALLHAVLGVVLIFSFVAIVRSNFRRLRGAMTLSVERGEQSMNLLYVAYGVVTLVFALAVQVAEAAQGYKVAIISFDYIALSYLFFFNSWFRNWILGKLSRIRKD